MWWQVDAPGQINNSFSATSAYRMPDIVEHGTGSGHQQPTTTYKALVLDGLRISHRSATSVLRRNAPFEALGIYCFIPLTVKGLCNCLEGRLDLVTFVASHRRLATTKFRSTPTTGLFGVKARFASHTLRPSRWPGTSTKD